MKLKPCPNPWCKSMKVGNQYTSLANKFYVLCSECRNATQMLLTEAEAIEAWNARPFESHAVEVLAKQISRTYRADSTSTYKYMRDKHRFIMDQESWDNKCRAEARELLGIDKEKEASE